METNMQAGSWGQCSLSGVLLRKIFQNWVSMSRFARQSPHSLIGVIIFFIHPKDFKSGNVLIGVLYLTLLLSGLQCICLLFFLGTHPACFNQLARLGGQDNTTQTEPSKILFCSAFQVDVIVELRPLEDDTRLYRDVVLLLKCAKSVNWVIKVHNVIGKLDIVVSQQHDNS